MHALVWFSKAHLSLYNIHSANNTEKYKKWYRFGTIMDRIWLKVVAFTKCLNMKYVAIEYALVFFVPIIYTFF